MANTYSQLRVHLVFVVRYRAAMIHPSWETKLYKYINILVRDKNCIFLAGNGTRDHIHLLLSHNPDTRISDLVKHIKANTSRWINANSFSPSRFKWQSGYGAFSVNSEDCERLKTYIARQKEHHKVVTFREEYEETLLNSEVDYREEFFFSNPE